MPKVTVPSGGLTAILSSMQRETHLFPPLLYGTGIVMFPLRPQENKDTGLTLSCAVWLLGGAMET
jgi:hypothetical protein